VTVRSISDSDKDFHDGKESLRFVLCDIDFSYWKFHVVKELKVADPKIVTGNSFPC
jgi:hypothetical protein